MAEIKTHTPFSVEIYQAQYEDFDKESLTLAVKDYASKTEGVRRSNNNGYQSLPNLQEREELKALMSWISETADIIIKGLGVTEYSNLMINESWVNINSGLNSHNQMHTHYGILSGVFYIQTPEGCGNLNIMNPGMNCLWPGHYKANLRNQHNAEAVFVAPTEGALFLWPSYIPHSVDCNNKDVERISISFNIDVS